MTENKLRYPFLITYKHPHLLRKQELRQSSKRQPPRFLFCVLSSKQRAKCRGGGWEGSGGGSGSGSDKEGGIPNSPLDSLTLLVEMKPEPDRLAAATAAATTTTAATAATTAADIAAVAAAVAATEAMRRTPPPTLTCSWDDYSRAAIPPSSTSVFDLPPSFALTGPAAP